MFNLTLGQYYPVDSSLHSMDPRAKITALLLYFILLFTAEGIFSLIFVTILGALAVFFSRVPLRVYWRGSRVLLFFVVIASLFNIFFTSGEVLWSAGIFEITKEGLLSAGVMILRLVLLIVVSYVLTYTTTPMELTNAIEMMGGPLQRRGLPVHEVAMIMSIALRFIPTIMMEADTIKKAQQSRGVDFNLRKFHQWAENMISLVVPLFVSAFGRSEDLANAMDARGYSGGAERTMYRELKMSSPDFGIVIFMILSLLAVILFRWL